MISSGLPTRLTKMLTVGLLIAGLSVHAQRRQVPADSTAPRSSVRRVRQPLPENHPRAIQPGVRRPGIYFPQAPIPGRWRYSIGAVFTTTPPELTEEIRVSVPAVDFNLQRGISKRWFINSRIQTQIIQSNVGIGVRYAAPITDRLFISAGDDMHVWFGALQIKDVFNSQAYGMQNFPNVSVGYRFTRDLQATIKGEAIIDTYYKSQVGNLSIERNAIRYNGLAVTFAVEQPLYDKKHVTLGFRAAYSSFNWQLWSLYDTFDRNLFYPQLIFGFIL